MTLRGHYLVGFWECLDLSSNRNEHNDEVEKTATVAVMGGLGENRLTISNLNPFLLLPPFSIPHRLARFTNSVLRQVTFYCLIKPS